ncbi:amidase [Limibaculum sp. FT325]|uniref:amidase n=1 Tax=Thermohalobaculum sediminis TaxID=2939436 RepID=UPI0020BEC097|nr:amidase [Limibaculum sediminis]MCL5778294.1 amidase [Limibaculum sediminis]
MTDMTDWGAVLARQGVPEAMIDGARAMAARHSAVAEGLAHDPAEPADPSVFPAALAAEAARPATGGGAAPAPMAPAPADATLGAGVEAIAALVRNRAVSAVELAERHLDALGRVGPRLNAVARLEPEAALAQARAIDARLARGDEVGPLAGVPMAHKDLYGREGWLLEAGSRILRGHVATRTATAIRALDAAGAVDLGRLNTVEFALGPDGRNAHTGPVRNPWNPAHLPGGSSSGSGACVAAGAVPAALGSDTGGSIRLPAGACGLVGLKPTAGLIGRSGVFPLAGSLDTVGPLCRSVRDAALLTQTMAGFDADDPQSQHRPPVDLMADIEDGLAGLRIGVAESYFFDPLDEATRAQIGAAADLMAAEGARVSRVAIPGIELANRLNVVLINVEAATQHRAWLGTRAADYGPETLGRMAAGLFVSAPAYLAALGRRARLLRAALDGPFGEVDAILAPVWPFEPPAIDADAGAPGVRAEDLGHCTRPFNYLGLPAVTLPCGVSANGLPVGFQLVGRPFAEATILRAARGYERARRFLDEHRPAVTA